jgi:hypothetical protein
MITHTITLTDPPEVVELKREFRRLDEREEELRIPAQARMPWAVVALAAVRTRKAAIAKEIFQLTSVTNL